MMWRCSHCGTLNTWRHSHCRKCRRVPKKDQPDPDEQPRYVYMIEVLQSANSQWGWLCDVWSTIGQAQNEIAFRKRSGFTGRCRIRRYIRDTRWRP